MPKYVPPALRKNADQKLKQGVQVGVATRTAFRAGEYVMWKGQEARIARVKAGHGGKENTYHLRVGSKIVESVPEREIALTADEHVPDGQSGPLDPIAFAQQQLAQVMQQAQEQGGQLTPEALLALAAQQMAAAQTRPPPPPGPSFRDLGSTHSSTRGSRAESVSSEAAQMTQSAKGHRVHGTDDIPKFGTRTTSNDEVVWHSGDASLKFGKSLSGQSSPASSKFSSGKGSRTSPRKSPRSPSAFSNRAANWSGSSGRSARSSPRFSPKQSLGQNKVPTQDLSKKMATLNLTGQKGILGGARSPSGAPSPFVSSSADNGDENKDQEG